jgi:hypothetical protein
MTEWIETRRHGPFDLRYGVMRLKPAPPSLRRPGAAELDWDGFCAQFFPGVHRHDRDALAAYESYRLSGSPRDGAGPKR